jgi:hypothetical protein
MHYTIRRAKTPPALDSGWDGPGWRDAEVANINNFYEKGSDHKPKTQAKVLYDDGGIYVQFLNDDRYVKCVHTEPHSHVFKDSCDEFFVMPKPFEAAGKGGYFNIEMNCGGQMLHYYIEDWTLLGGGRFGKFTKIDPKDLATIQIFHTLPKTVSEEVTEPIQWRLAYFVPNSFFEKFVGPLEKPSERKWRGNFQKCADGTSHPHWATWSPIVPNGPFHQPKFFGDLRFEV